ncbi:reverse transcriptase domain-containing protein [Tanacetum coccineum]
MTTPVKKRNNAKIFEFHGEVGHTTDECMHLREQIKEMLKAGKLSHLIKELKQNNGKEQPKVTKKGETYGKDKASPSPYNGIIGRPGVRKLQAVPSTAHGMLKIPTEGGDGCSPVRQKKRGQAADRNQAIQKEVGKLVEAGIMKEIGRNLEVYVDDLVIKSRTEDEIVRDIEETFKTLKEINMKLTPKKCTFRVEEGMFLGYKVNTKGMKVCPDKVDAVLSLPSLKCLKDVQKLNGKLASLNRFLAKSAENSLPFFKTLKKCTKKSDFHWTTKAEEAFKQMKQLIDELPMLTAPMEKEELIVYLAVAKETVTAVLMMEREAKQMPILFETYVKSKDLDLWNVIIDGDFPPIQNNPETKKDEIVPFHKQNDDLKKKLAKNNEAKMKESSDEDSSTSDSKDEEYAMAVRNFKKFFKRQGRFEELIQENVFGLGGHRDRLPTCLDHMLYYVVAEEQYILAYFFVKRIKCATATPTANLPYGMFLTRLYRHVMETYPHLDNGTYDIVERVMHPLALRQT